MDKTLKLTAQTRQAFGKKIHSLRNQGLIPGNIFGKNFDSQAIQVNKNDFATIYNAGGETSVVAISLGDKTIPVLINNLHLHPITNKVMHIDFRFVDLKQKITANIPLEVAGESPAVKDGGVLVQTLDEVEVEALPTDLPEKIVIDISKLEKIGDSMTLADITIDPKVVINHDLTSKIILIQEPKVEVEPEVVPAAEEAAAPAAGDTEKPEAAPAEGEKKPE
jgi:large subunit ribosomal protein L25